MNVLPDSERPADDVRARATALASTIDDTRVLTQRVAHMLFFEYGEVPKARRVYSLIGNRGSLTTISDELSNFFAELRKQNWSALDVPNVPEEAVRQISRGVGAMWRFACKHARAQFEQSYAEKEAKLDEKQVTAQVAIEEAKRTVDAANAHAAELTSELRIVNEKAAVFVKNFEDAKSTIAELEKKQIEREDLHARQLAELKEQIRDLTAHSQKLVDELSEERTTAREEAKHWMQEVASEREAVKRTQKETVKLRAEMANETSKWQEKTSDLEVLLAAEKQRVRKLHDEIQSLRTAQADAEAEVRRLTEQIAQSSDISRLLSSMEKSLKESIVKNVAEARLSRSKSRPPKSGDDATVPGEAK